MRSKKKLVALIFSSLLFLTLTHAQAELGGDMVDLNSGTDDHIDYPSDLNISNTRSLNTAKNDLLNFYLFVKYLRKFNDIDDLKLLEEYAREFVSSHIDVILKKEIKNEDPEVKKILLDLQYIKASLFYECKDIKKACSTLKDLDVQYYENIDIDVDFMANAFKQQKPFMALTLFRHLCK